MTERQSLIPLRFRGRVRSVKKAPQEFTLSPVEWLEARNLALLEEMNEDENRVRSWHLVVYSGDDKFRIPAKCSRSQIRKAKIALHQIGLDALAVEE